MRTGPALTLSAMLLLSPLAAWAEDAGPACGAVDVALAAPFAAWTSRTELASAARTADLPAAALTPGRAVNAALHPAAQLAFVMAPGKPLAPGGQGGMLSLTISQPGVYAIALGSGAWIDVLKGVAPVESTAHSHGPACSSIHKIVDFPLQPGSYVVQLSGGPDPITSILVVRRP